MSGSMRISYDTRLSKFTSIRFLQKFNFLFTILCLTFLATVNQIILPCYAADSEDQSEDVLVTPVEGSSDDYSTDFTNKTSQFDPDSPNSLYIRHPECDFACGQSPGPDYLLSSSNTAVTVDSGDSCLTCLPQGWLGCSAPFAEVPPTENLQQVQRIGLCCRVFKCTKRGEKSQTNSNSKSKSSSSESFDSSGADSNSQDDIDIDETGKPGHPRLDQMNSMLEYMYYIFWILPLLLYRYILTNAWFYLILVSYFILDKLLARFFGLDEVSVSKLKRRFESWPPKNFQQLNANGNNGFITELEKEEFAVLVLKPGSVVWDYQEKLEKYNSEMKVKKEEERRQREEEKRQRDEEKKRKKDNMMMLKSKGSNNDMKVQQQDSDDKTLAQTGLTSQVSDISTSTLGSQISQTGDNNIKSSIKSSITSQLTGAVMSSSQQSSVQTSQYQRETIFDDLQNIKNDDNVDQDQQDLSDISPVSSPTDSHLHGQQDSQLTSRGKRSRSAESKKSDGDGAGTDVEANSDTFNNGLGNINLNDDSKDSSRSQSQTKTGGPLISSANLSNLSSPNSKNHNDSDNIQEGPSSTVKKNLKNQVSDFLSRAKNRAAQASTRDKSKMKIQYHPKVMIPYTVPQLPNLTDSKSLISLSAPQSNSLTSSMTMSVLQSGPSNSLPGSKTNLQNLNYWQQSQINTIQTSTTPGTSSNQRSTSADRSSEPSGRNNNSNPGSPKSFSAQQLHQQEVGHGDRGSGMIPSLVGFNNSSPDLTNISQTQSQQTGPIAIGTSTVQQTLQQSNSLILNNTSMSLDNNNFNGPYSNYANAFKNHQQNFHNNIGISNANQISQQQQQTTVPQKFPMGLTPALAFVNPKSGGQEGYETLRKLRAVLHPIQVINLKEKVILYSPIDLLRWFVQTFGGSRLRIIVCGGDGTVDWVFSMLDSLDTEGVFTENDYPPLAIWPLGTGNDLARVFGWHRTSNVKKFLNEVASARSVFLDRWQVTTSYKNPIGKTQSQNQNETAAAAVKDKDNNTNSTVTVTSSTSPTPTVATVAKSKDTVTTESTTTATAEIGSVTTTLPASALGGTTSGTSGGGGNIQVTLEGVGINSTTASAEKVEKYMSNYLGIGVDATVVGNFHDFREEMPGLFWHQKMNRLYYAVIGLTETMIRSCADFHKRVKIKCDGVEYELEDGIEGIIVCNITSYAGGARLWAGPLYSQVLLDQNTDLDEGALNTMTGSSSQNMSNSSNSSTMSSDNHKFNLNKPVVMSPISQNASSSTKRVGAATIVNRGPGPSGSQQSSTVLSKTSNVNRHSSASSTYTQVTNTGPTGATVVNKPLSLSGTTQRQSSTFSSASTGSSGGNSGIGGVTGTGPGNTAESDLIELSLEQSRDEESSLHDGKLDIVLLRGAEHLALITVGLDRAIRLCQASVVEFSIDSRFPIPLQIDGEPWHTPGISKLRIELKQPRAQAVMLRRCEHGLAERAFVKTLTQAVESGLILPWQRDSLLREMTYRLQQEERQQYGGNDSSGGNLRLEDFVNLGDLGRKFVKKILGDI